MVTKDLGMTLNYCNHWGIPEAVREFFQNCYDAEKVDENNKMFFDYDVESQLLTIGNKLGSLSRDSLLLGCTSKEDDKRTVGRFGEGYKVATTVLLRCGCSVRIKNYSAREVWTSRVIKRRKSKENVGAFDIEVIPIWKKVPSNNLIFEISGVSIEDYNAIKDKILHLHEDLGECYKVEDATILLDERYSGNLYVNGLFVCKNPRFKYGYDLDPSLITLNRDRDIVNDTDLSFITSKLIAETGDTSFIVDNLNIMDGQFLGYYLESYTQYKNYAKNIGSSLQSKLKSNYGDDVIVSSNRDEVNNLFRQGKNAVLVSQSEYRVLASVQEDLDIIEVYNKDSDKERLRDWFSRLEGKVDKEFYEEGLSLLNLVLPE